MAARRAALLPVAALFLCSCSGPAPSTAPQGSHPDNFRGLRAAERAARSVPVEQTSEVRDRRVALVNGTPISWEDLRPSMAESAGGPALQEAILDRLVADQMRTRGLSITPDDIAAERLLLIDSITRDAAASPAQAEELLDQVRRARGLGDFRFQRLLERNARMRKLVAGTVEVSPEEVAQAFQIAHGARYRARAIVLATERDAAETRGALASQPGDLSIRFAEAASRHSLDPSADRGGLLEPISPADPAYPASIRGQLDQLGVGEMSPVLAVDRGFAIILLEERLPPDGATLDARAPALGAEVRKRRERLAMDDLASRLLRSAEVTVIDPHLGWSWESIRPRPQ